MVSSAPDRQELPTLSDVLDAPPMRLGSEEARFRCLAHAPFGGMSERLDDTRVGDNPDNHEVGKRTLHHRAVGTQQPLESPARLVPPPPWDPAGIRQETNSLIRF